MKKRYWIIAILIIAPIFFLAVYFSIFPFVPLIGNCKWSPIEDFKVTVNNEEEAANLINEWAAKQYPGETREDWKNLTANEIYLKENEFFIVKDANELWQSLKVDRNGKILSFHCPV